MDQSPRESAEALAEEAARLVQSLRESFEATQLAAEHSGPTCRACPVCQLLGVLRQVRPEVVEHLSTAMSELALAVRELLGPPPADAPPPDEPDRPAPPEQTVERIEIA
ncbi:MAG: hypothetical protein WAL50_11670 [Kineosporiaceae bacterium]|jgi:hypothetical protein